jgi:putative serine protease PepD
MLMYRPNDPGTGDTGFERPPSHSTATPSTHEVAASTMDAPNTPEARETSSFVVTPPPRPVVVKQGARWWQVVLAAVLGAALAVGGMQVIGNDDPATTAAPTIATVNDRIVDAADAVPADTPVAETPVPSVPTPEEIVPAPATVDPVAVGETVIPSIVTVEVVSNGRVVGSGSGVIITDDGYVVTNDHVVAVGSSIQVVLSDGRTTYQADLVGTDPLTDLAVLDLDTTGLDPIELGAASALSVGDTAVAVGSPLGLEGGPSLTVGVISAFGRQVQTGPSSILYGMIQTDAPITSGSSGGALVDGAGRLIGITTAVGVSDVGVEGIGFATPVEIVGRVVDELIDDGSVEHAFLGITGTTAFEDAADGARVASGVEVGTVEPGSAAAGAGLEPGDVITSIDGRPVETMDELIVALRVRFPGDEVELTINGSSVIALLGAR